MQMSQRPKSHGHMGYQGAQWHPRLTAKYNKYIHGLVTYRDFARPAGALGAQGYFIISIPFVLYYTTKFLQGRETMFHPSFWSRKREELSEWMHGDEKLDPREARFLRKYSTSGSAAPASAPASSAESAPHH